MTLRTDLLPVFDDARQIMQDFGLRTTRVTIRVRTWSGGKVKLGTPTDVDTEILPRPRVRELDTRRVKVDKITPQHATGGYSRQQLRPDDAAGLEYFYRLVTPDGVTRDYALTELDTSRNFGYELTLTELDRGGPTW